MKPNNHTPVPPKPPDSARARARRQQAKAAELDERMASNLEWEARFGAMEPERKEFARRMAALLRGKH